MSLFDIFRQDKGKQKFKDLKQILQFNPEYFKELDKIKLNRELGITFL
jgi:hypothetical protein